MNVNPKTRMTPQWIQQAVAQNPIAPVLGPDGQPLAPPVLNVIIDGERQDTPAAPPAG